MFVASLAYGVINHHPRQLGLFFSLGYYPPLIDLIKKKKKCLINPRYSWMQRYANFTIGEYSSPHTGFGALGWVSEFNHLQFCLCSWSLCHPLILPSLEEEIYLGMKGATWNPFPCHGQENKPFFSGWYQIPKVPEDPWGAKPNPTFYRYENWNPRLHDHLVAEL